MNNASKITYLLLALFGIAGPLLFPAYTMSIAFFVGDGFNDIYLGYFGWADWL
jgi:hypothetical protein